MAAVEVTLNARAARFGDVPEQYTLATLLHDGQDPYVKHSAHQVCAPGPWFGGLSLVSAASPTSALSLWFGVGVRILWQLLLWLVVAHVGMPHNVYIKRMGPLAIGGKCSDFALSFLCLWVFL
jgi:hypothetical protein